MMTRWSKKGEENYIVWKIHRAWLEMTGPSFLVTSLRGKPICFIIWYVSVK